MEDMGPLPAEHPRAGIVRLAERRLRDALLELDGFGLTSAEYLKVLADAQSEALAFLIARERQEKP
jgi:hypothetical protein